MVMRTYGLSGSGMDIDQMVKDLMKARRASYDKVWQKKVQTEWKKQDVNTIYTLSEDFRNKTIADFRKQGNLSPKQVTSTNETVASATANGDAANVSHSLTVQQLADGIKLSSSGSITDTASGKTKGTLAQQFGIAAGSSFDLTINGKKVTVTDTMTLNEVVSSINKAGADVKANYDTTLDRFYLYSNKTGSAAVVNFNGTSDQGLDFLFNDLKIGTTGSNLSTIGMTSQNTFSDGTATVGDAFGISSAFTLNVSKNGVAAPVAIDPTDTIEDMLGKIEAKLGAGSATLDAATGRITIKAVDINNGWSIEGADATGQDFLSNKLGMKQLVQNGQDAVINLDGVTLRQGSNSFTVSNVTYTLKSTSFLDSSNQPIPTNISIQPDIDKAISNVQNFVDSYNTYITLLQQELTENKYSDFAPLTDAQKADMKDSDIKAWEDKAKSGSLRRDPILTKLVADMRMSFSNPIKGLTGKYQSATDIGITTGKYFDDDGNLTTESSSGGKMYVDEDTLRKALEEDPDIVFKIFGTPGDTQNTEGVGNRLYDQMYTALNTLKTEAGTPNVTDTTSNMAKSIASYTDQLDRMNDQLSQIEDRYYKQFDAMETALSNMNKQSAWLTQQSS